MTQLEYVVTSIAKWQKSFAKVLNPAYRGCLERNGRFESISVIDLKNAFHEIIITIL